MQPNIQPGDMLKAVNKPRTYRFVEKVQDGYIYTRKPNRTPCRIPVWDIEKWEKVEINSNIFYKI